jgi:O-antigen ligase
MQRVRVLAGRLAEVEIWPIAILVAASAASTRMLPAALAIGVFFWGARRLAHGRLSVRTPADWPFAVLVILVPVTILVTPLPDVTRTQALRLLVGLTLYYAVANWTTSARRVRLLASGFVIAGLSLALTAPVTVSWFAEVKLLFIPESLYRSLPLLLSDPIHPNIMAGSLVILLPFALAPLLFDWSGQSRGERSLCIAACLILSFMIVLTKSRGGILALSAIVVAMVALRWRRGWLIAPAGAAVGVVSALWIGPMRMIDALTTTQSIGGMGGRLEVWSRALYMIQDFPFTGIGMGAFQQVANLLYPFFLAGPDAKIPHAHNLFLQVAVDLGLPGLVAWLALFLLVCVAAWQVYRHGRITGNRWLMGLGAALLASQVALTVHGLTDATTWGTRPAIIVWGLWGLAMAGLRVSREV